MNDPSLDIYLESGARRSFAGALDWPGWCRMGRDEAAALGSLLAYGPRYARALASSGLGFQAPDDLAALVVVERLPGSATTDFGAPDAVPSGDDRPLDEPELQRLRAILGACWQAFDAAVEMARGKTLRTGPRGGGRTLEGMLEHVLGAEAAYLAALGGRPPGGKADSAAPGTQSPEPLRQAILAALAASARGEIAPFGPRGGRRWCARYFVRRAAWHVLDHAWEIEDRVE